MNRFIVVVCISAILSTTYVMHAISQIKTTSIVVIQLMPEVAVEDLPDPLDVRPMLTAEQLKEISCLQKNLYFEARDQPENGQLAVAWVTINRVLHEKYPNSICKVVHQGIHTKNGTPVRNACKFSWYCDGKSDEPNRKNKIENMAWNYAHTLATTMVTACMMRYNGTKCPSDPTYGAIFYHNPRTSSPKWAAVKKKTVVVGEHAFYAMADN